MGEYLAPCTLDHDQIGASPIVKVDKIGAKKRKSFSDPILYEYGVEHLNISQLWEDNVVYVPNVGGWIAEGDLEACLDSQASCQMLLRSMLSVSTLKWSICVKNEQRRRLRDEQVPTSAANDVPTTPPPYAFSAPVSRPPPPSNDDLKNEVCHLF